MTDKVSDEGIHALLITKEQFIEAPVATSFEALLDELGPEGTLPDGAGLNMKLEAFPGGRWYRDLGSNAGHHWGHVQVIKPPHLLEISGPFFMSYPAINHLQYRLTAEGTGTSMALIHRAMGQITVDHREGVSEGWTKWLEKIQKRAEISAKEGR